MYNNGSAGNEDRFPKCMAEVDDQLMVNNSDDPLVQNWQVSDGIGFSGGSAGSKGLFVELSDGVDNPTSNFGPGGDEDCS